MMQCVTLHAVRNVATKSSAQANPKKLIETQEN